jgi:hypothetical protein
MLRRALHGEGASCELEWQVGALQPRKAEAGVVGKTKGRKKIKKGADTEI